jgi:hypothetical protein
MAILPLDLEADITAAAVRALRRRAEAIRKRASDTSESAVSLRIAKSWDAIADDLSCAIPARN